MKFNSIEEEAWRFWSHYGAKIGFGVRKQYINKNETIGKITSFRFVYCKEGLYKKDKKDYLIINRQVEIRTNCSIRIGFMYVKDIENIVNDFVTEHNHP